MDEFEIRFIGFISYLGLWVILILETIFIFSIIISKIIILIDFLFETIYTPQFLGFIIISIVAIILGILLILSDFVLSKGDKIE